MEAIGVIGEAPDKISCIESIADIQTLPFNTDAKLAILTQTTLNAQDTAVIINELKRKYPNVVLPPSSDICYATTDRQLAVENVIQKEHVDLVLVVGSDTSSNSKRLKEMAEKLNVKAYLIDDVSMIQDEWLTTTTVVAITAGASSPEHLVTDVVNYFVTRGATR